MGVRGISEEKASQAMRSRPKFLAQNLDSLQSLVRRADELGVPRQSPTFLLLLVVLQSISKKTLEAKHKLLSGLGLSESDFFTAIRKKPTYVEYFSTSHAEKDRVLHQGSWLSAFFRCPTPIVTSV
ncbi:hypothetical protein ZIOFF_037133 [Zingiber officinale]|uniref:Uncharacterized protein n=1 Tax=Zingiber officinale TaxID=94328 RepID=A0A8J5GCV0_ZINOF|nr:hypothetical protein ZIOFF_037133 [Zingiber officinale]